MDNTTKSVIAAGLLAGGVFASAALYAHGDTMSGESMMGKESGGMMQQMNRMMENCNKMMESHADTQQRPGAREKPAG